jgi:hypothetical protein
MSCIRISPPSPKDSHSDIVNFHHKARKKKLVRTINKKMCRLLEEIQRERDH